MIKKVSKIIASILLTIFIIYTIYRNVKMHTIPSSTLIKDVQTIQLYQSLLPNGNNLEWNNYYFSHDSVTKEEIPDEIKNNIAFKNMGTGEYVILEEKYKEIYETIFDKGSYKPVSSFMGGCNYYQYNSNKSTYEKSNSVSCKINTKTIVSKIIEATQNKDDTMDIIVAIAYLDSNKKEVYRKCDASMEKCTEKIASNVNANEYSEDDLDYKKQKLSKYKFSYNYDAEENKYYFREVKKIN